MNTRERFLARSDTRRDQEISLEETCRHLESGAAPLQRNLAEAAVRLEGGPGSSPTH